MATRKAEKRIMNVSKAPLFYADQPAALEIGGQVSRLTFGVIDSDFGNFPRPVVTIAIPTSSLLEMVNDLKETFDSPSFKTDAVKALEDAAKLIASSGLKGKRSIVKIAKSTPPALKKISSTQ